MAIVANDIVFRLTGGTANTSPAASLGGDMSTAGGGVIPKTNTKNSIFADVPSSESTPGSTKYRAIYVYNNHGTLTYQNAQVKIDIDTTSPDTDLAIGKEATVGITGKQSIANEDTAPSGITFESTEDAYVALGNIPAGSGWMIWIRRTVNAAAAAYTGDSFTLATTGDTAA